MFVEDNDSKFGTLVKILKPIAFDSACSFSVQAGRTLLTFAAKKERKWYSCLVCCSKEEEEIVNQLTDESDLQQIINQP